MSHSPDERAGRLRTTGGLPQAAYAAFPDDDEAAVFAALGELATTPADRASREHADRAAAIAYAERWAEDPALVGTLREHRGRGLAGALLAEVMRASRAAGLERCVLDVDTENPTGALGVYTRLGFAATDRDVAYSIEY